MEQQPTTPPPNHTDPIPVTPEHGLVAPLSIHQLAAWEAHAWYDESERRMQEALMDAWALHDSLCESNTLQLSRVVRLILWIESCLDSLPEP